MTEEFNLSEKIKNTKEGWAYLGDLSVSDVKEFIKRLKHFISNWECYEGYTPYTENERKDLNFAIDKLAGDKLNGSSQ